MVTSAACLTKFGDPHKYTKHLIVWDVPTELEIGFIPKKVYCNKLLVKPLEQAFRNIINAGFAHIIKSWDGCWNIRLKRGGRTWSLHSWAIAIDLNAAENCFGCKPKLSTEFVKCFTDAGFEWGGTWTKPDGMHFQLKTID